jgi:arylsulfatase A-like enzyme
MLKRRSVGRLLTLAGVALAVAIAWALPAPQPVAGRPNVLLIMTDDQGYGDLGAHGNPKIRTPHLDRLARDSVRVRSFYVSPVCSPTRASLLTGRYNYRTGVVDTYLGRSLMHADEVTLAEMLGAGGYRTGIFGKWHLGDNYPLRAMDQGFEESLTLNGGGIGQPSDPPDGTSYVDPLLRRNGTWVRTKGYVSDVITDAALDFIGRNRNRPFFAYLTFNAPHTPLEVPPDKYAAYKAMSFTAADFPSSGHPIAKAFDPDTTAKIYGMVENIDENVGRVLARLDELKLASNTMVIFLTDNGPQQPRYNAGLRRLKGTVHDGGIRVPFYVRWPTRLKAGREIDRVAAHIDVTPTIIDAAGVAAPAGVRFDGVSILTLLDGTREDSPDRSLFFQWHRGDAPEPGRSFAVRTQRYKLVQPEGNGEKPPPPGAPLMLFDMAADPLEERDIAAEHPEIVARLQREYQAWFTDVTGSRTYTDAGVARIAIGAPQENPVRLTRQDWRGPQAGWTPGSVGHWLVDVTRSGQYDIELRFPATAAPAAVHLSIGETSRRIDVPSGATTASFSRIRLPQGPATLAPRIVQGEQTTGALDVVVHSR